MAYGAGLGILASVLSGLSGGLESIKEDKIQEIKDLREQKLAALQEEKEKRMKLWELENITNPSKEKDIELAVKKEEKLLPIKKKYEDYKHNLEMDKVKYQQKQQNYRARLAASAKEGVSRIEGGDILGVGALSGLPKSLINEFKENAKEKKEDNKSIIEQYNAEFQGMKPGTKIKTADGKEIIVPDLKTYGYSKTGRWDWDKLDNYVHHAQLYKANLIASDPTHPANKQAKAYLLKETKAPWDLPVKYSEDEKLNSLIIAVVNSTKDPIWGKPLSYQQMDDKSKKRYERVLKEAAKFFEIKENRPKKDEFIKGLRVAKVLSKPEEDLFNEYFNELINPSPVTKTTEAISKDFGSAYNQVKDAVKKNSELSNFLDYITGNGVYSNLNEDEDL